MPAVAVLAIGFAARPLACGSDPLSQPACSGIIRSAMAKWATILLLLLVACTPDSSRSVTLVADGETRTLPTEALTVRDFLAEAAVILDEDDRVVPVEPTFIEDEMTIRVVRVETRTETEQREIPFERRTVRDASIPAGETRLLEPGVAGIEELTYRITIEDDVEIDRLLVRRITVQEPRGEVILVGAQAELKSIPITGTVAYVADHNAWVMQGTSSNQRRVTYAGDLDGRVFALSPEGSHLLFTRIPSSTRPGAPHLDQEGEEEDEMASLNTLWMIETATADAEPVELEVHDVLWAGWESGGQVEPAGTGCRIAYATGASVEGSPGWKAENDLWIARPRPGDGRLLSHRRVGEPNVGGAYGWWGTTYAWSPDGFSLAYARADEVGTVRIRDGAPVPLMRFPPYRTYAPWVWTPTVSWSTEGQFVVTTLHGSAPTGEASEDSPVFDVWTLSADGTITAELISGAGMWAAPAYAPEGDAIAFGQARTPYASQTSGYDLYVMDRDGSDRRHLFPPQEEIGLEYPEFAWGPGGDRMIVVYQGNLYLVHVDSGLVQQLVDTGGVTAVRWRGERPASLPRERKPLTYE